MNKRTLKKYVRQIKKLVESTHWTKRHYETQNKDGKDMYCLVGAARHVVGVDYQSPYDPKKWSESQEVYKALYDSIKEVEPKTRSQSVESWNDRSQTKREDVIKVLDNILDAK